MSVNVNTIVTNHELRLRKIEDELSIEKIPLQSSNYKTQKKSDETPKPRPQPRTGRFARAYPERGTQKSSSTTQVKINNNQTITQKQTQPQEKSQQQEHSQNNSNEEPKRKTITELNQTVSELQTENTSLKTTINETVKEVGILKTQLENVKDLYILFQKEYYQFKTQQTVYGNTVNVTVDKDITTSIDSYTEPENYSTIGEEQQIWTCNKDNISVKSDKSISQSLNTDTSVLFDKEKQSEETQQEEKQQETQHQEEENKPKKNKGKRKNQKVVSLDIAE